MGSLVGSSTALSTWAKFRCAWCLQENFDITESGDYVISYGSGQKAAASGSGLIRWRPRPISPTFSDELQPTISNYPFTQSFPPPIGGNRIFSFPSQTSATSPTGLESAAVTDELKAELTGVTVTFSGGYSTTISNTLWTEYRYTWNPAQPSPFVAGDVTSIGKLTAF